MGKTIALTVLDNIEIATPCTASWEEMTGNDQTRYCSHCSLNVYNLSAMTREEATGIIAGAEGRVCVRLYRRTDGTVLTQDCPTGLRAARQRVSRSVRNIAATAATLVAGMFGLGTRQAWAQGGVSARVVMGGVGRSVHVEPEESKTKRDTLQATKDTNAVDNSRTMIMGEMAIRPVDTASAPMKAEPLKVEPVKVEPAVTRPVTIEPTLEEPVVIEPLRPRLLRTEPEVSEPVLVMGGMVVAGGPDAESKDQTEEPACDSGEPVVDDIIGPDIR